MTSRRRRWRSAAVIAKSPIDGRPCKPPKFRDIKPMPTFNRAPWRARCEFLALAMSLAVMRRRIGWWNQTVRSAGRKWPQEVIGAERGQLERNGAEEHTGIKHQQVSRWAKAAGSSIPLSCSRFPIPRHWVVVQFELSALQFRAHSSNLENHSSDCGGSHSEALGNV